MASHVALRPGHRVEGAWVSSSLVGFDGTPRSDAALDFGVRPRDAA